MRRIRRAVVALGAGTCIWSALLSGPASPAAATPATISVGDVAAVEADTGSVAVLVPVDLSTPLPATTVVSYQFTVSGDGTADASDAVLKSGKVTFPAGAVWKTVRLSLIGDTLAEPDQHLELRLSNPVGSATLAKSIGAVTIIDNDADGVDPGVEVSVGDVEVEEADAGTHAVHLPITLSRPATTTLKLTFRIGCSDVLDDRDIAAKPTGTITFNAGQQSKSLKVRVAADLAPEDLAAYTMALRAAVGPMSLQRDTGSIVISDNDGAGTPGDDLPVDGIEQISLASDGSAAQYPIPLNGNGNRLSQQASISADGRAVAFASDACNLVPGDTNGMKDIFVRDRVTHSTTRVSVHGDGSQIEPSEVEPLVSWGSSMHAPSINADGRFVVFTSTASLLPSDATAWTSWVAVQDAYLYDRETDTVELVSSGDDGFAIGGVFATPTISADGRFVAISVLGGHTTPYPDGSDPILHTMIRDRELGTLTEVPAALGALSTQLADDGRHVLFVQPGAAGTHATIQVLDLETGLVDRVDVTSDEVGAENVNFGSMMAPSISSDGRYVVFRSDAWNLIAGMTGPLASYSGAFPQDLVHVYVRDRVLGTTALLGDPEPDSTYGSAYHEGLAVSDDGQRVVQGGSPQGLVIDVATGTQSYFGFPYNEATSWNSRLDSPQALSADGNFVVFTSELWPFGDVFVQRIG